MAHRLLLADDSVTIQRVIELTFADEDIQVTAVGDGQRAIEIIRSERPDIVLADVDMPERNGFEVATFIKQSHELAHIPVILLTGAFEPVDDDRVRAAGCDAVLAKPFEPQMLIARVKELLAHRAGGARAITPEPAPRPSAYAPPSPFVPPVMAEPVAAAVSSAFAETADTTVDLSRSPVSLDEYFDQLDAAFASHGADQPKPAPVEPSSLDSWPEPAPGREWIPVPQIETAPPTPAPTPSPATPDRVPRVVEVPPGAVVAPPLATTFAALLAEERGEPIPPGALPAPGQIPAHFVDSIVDQVTVRVAERLADRALREQVADIVSAVAERLVREEIERVRREAQ